MCLSILKKMDASKKVEWILRIGIAGEFLGHGLLAVGGKKAWIGWISQMTTVDAAMAGNLLLVIGIMDVLVALSVLVKPMKPVLVWATIWGFWTALVRPLVGESWLDFIERFANWAAPLALFHLLSSSKSQTIVIVEEEKEEVAV